MAYKVFQEMRLARMARVPQSYARTVRWLPRIGDIVPDLRAETTQGTLDFHTFAEGRWIVIFGHPAPFSAVCSTELAALSAALPEFSQRGVGLLGISPGAVNEQRRWHEDIRRLTGIRVGIPMIADDEGLIADLFGMMHGPQAGDCAIRKTFVLGPDLRIRAILEYPVAVGRSTDELLRLIDALQTAEALNVGVGADWRRGADVIQNPATLGAARFDPPQGWRRVCAWWRTAPDPYAEAESDQALLPAMVAA